MPNPSIPTQASIQADIALILEQFRELIDPCAQAFDFAKQIGNMFNSDLFSDLVLIVSDQRFPVHKVILAARSEYFRTLLTNGWRESSQKEIKLEESNAKLFEKLLDYIYSAEIQIDTLSLDETYELFTMANRYLLLGFQKAIGNRLASFISIENFCMIYSTACAFSADALKAACWKFADEWPCEILRSDDFTNLQAQAILELITRASFKPPSKVEYLNAMFKWTATTSDKKEADALLSKVDLLSMPLDVLLTVGNQRPSCIFTQDYISDAVDTIRAKLHDGGSTLVNDNAKARSTGEDSKTMRILIETTGQAQSDGYQFFWLSNIQSSHTIGRVKIEIRSRLLSDHDAFKSYKLRFRGIVSSYWT